MAIDARTGNLVWNREVADHRGGATNWMSPTYSPRTGLRYVMSYDGEAQFFIRDVAIAAGNVVYAFGLDYD